MKKGEECLCAGLQINLLKFIWLCSNQLFLAPIFIGINYRRVVKDFFNVNLLEIQKKAKEFVVGDFDFKVTALAEEYYESLKLRATNNEIK